VAPPSILLTQFPNCFLGPDTNQIKLALVPEKSHQIANGKVNYFVVVLPPRRKGRRIADYSSFNDVTQSKNFEERGEGLDRNARLTEAGKSAGAR